MTAKSSKGEKRTCKNGHVYYKSSDCPTCPYCEAEKKPKDGFLSGFSAPARRALEANGVFSVKQLSKFTEKEVMSWHGMGPASLPKMKKALSNASLNFKK